MEKKNVLIPDMPVELHRKVKALAATRGVTLQSLWQEILELGLKTLNIKKEDEI